MKYVEIAIGKTTHQGAIIPINELHQKMKICNMTNLELYRSIFLFDEKIKDHMKTHKSPSGYIGNLYLDSIILDIDRGKNTDDFTLHRARVFVEKLMNEWKIDEEWLQIWYSGTGYHIQIPDIFGFKPSPDMDKTVKETLDTYFSEADTSFYHKAGLIRVGKTINNKSKLYKTPLSLEEFQSLKALEIQELASKPRLEFKFKKVVIEPKYSHLIQTNHDKQIVDQVISSPTKIVTCVQRMYNLGEEEGTRHTRIMRMTSAWRRAGMPLSAIITAMKAYAPNMDAYEVEKHVTDVFKKGYMYGCDDSIMKEFCDPTCIFYKRKNYAPSIINSKDLEKQFVEFARTDFTGKAINLQEYWQLEQPFWLYPGFYVQLIGDTGLNKTALFQNLAIELSNFSPTLYLSTEFGNLLLFRRFCQIAHKLTKDQVVAHYQQHTNTLSNAFAHIHYLKVVPSLNEIEKLVGSFTPKIVMIDTIDDIPVYDNRNNQLQGVQAEDALGKGLKQLAEKYETIVMGVHHIRKNATEHISKDGEIKNLPLTLNASKGAGTFVQKADIVFALEGNRNQALRTLSVLKSRDDAPFKKAFVVDVDTFRFEQLNGDNYKSGLV